MELLLSRDYISNIANFDYRHNHYNTGICVRQDENSYEMMSQRLRECVDKWIYRVDKEPM